MINTALNIAIIFIKTTLSKVKLKNREFYYIVVLTLDNILLWIREFIRTNDNYSEDIDIAVNPVFLGVPEGDLTKRQIKKLRKESSLFVLEELTPMICEELKRQGLLSFVTVNAQPNGEGDATYPEPRQIYLHYKSVFNKELTYLRPDIVLEVSARSLLEPTEAIQIKSIIGEHLPITPLADSAVYTAIPAKTFLEKAFLLHELFSIPGHGMIAERKSRHLYDLYTMMNKDFAQKAIEDDALLVVQ